MKKLAFMVFSLCLTSSIFAFQLNGTMSDNSDGTYAVTLDNSEGLTYTGSAVLLGDGTLKISVVDEKGEFYLGVAKVNQEGIYDLKLRSNSSGDFAVGKLELN